MRFNLVLFVAGAWLLQLQPELPDFSWAWGLLVLLVIALFLYFIQGRGPRYTCAVLLNLFFLGAGFFWAVWLAQARLADALAAEWEGRDIQLIGTVASLPQTNERG
ncbi:MAG: DUF4131 domain-containing protein, partial [Burkholderiales bacterium]